MIDGIHTSGSLPTLQRLLQFAGARHRLITHNIANISTPHFRPLDVDPAEFQNALKDAVDARKRRPDARNAPLELKNTRNIRFSADGMEFDPQPAGDNLLFHDGNDRNLETLMQDLVENFMVYRQAAELIRNRINILNSAIAERV